MHRPVITLSMLWLALILPSAAFANTPPTFSCRWDRIDGPPGWSRWTSGWVRNLVIPRCDHNYLCSCGQGHNYCGQHQAGARVIQWVSQCFNPYDTASYPYYTLACTCVRQGPDECLDRNRNDPLNAECELRRTDPFQSER